MEVLKVTTRLTKDDIWQCRIAVERAVLDGSDPNDAQAHYRLRDDAIPDSAFYLRETASADSNERAQ